MIYTLYVKNKNENTHILDMGNIQYLSVYVYQAYDDTKPSMSLEALYIQLFFFSSYSSPFYSGMDKQEALQGECKASFYFLSSHL